MDARANGLLRADAGGVEGRRSYNGDAVSAQSKSENEITARGHVSGSVDGVALGRLFGWASLEGAAVDLAVFVDGNRIGQVRTTGAREDLAAAGVGERAFWIELPLDCFDDEVHEILIEDLLAGQAVLGTPKRMVIERASQAPSPVGEQPQASDGAGQECAPESLESPPPALGEADSGPVGQTQRAIDPNVRDYVDRAFYLQSYADVAAANVDPVEHFLASGAAELRDPSATFSAKRYLAEHPNAIGAGVTPIEHWLAGGRKPWVVRKRRSDRLSSFLVAYTPPRAHPLFDELYVYTANRGVHRGDELAALAAAGRRSFEVNPLFNTAFYRGEARLHQGGAAQAIEHYLSEGWKSGLSPHPLFDVAHYEAQSGALNEPHLVHYLREGWKKGFSPHPLFDPAHYSQRARLPNTVCPLIHYLLLAEDDAEPHYLFDDRVVRPSVNVGPAPLGMSVTTELEAYLGSKQAWRASTHVFFDPQYYAERWRTSFVAEKETAPSLRTGVNPLLHYLQHGAAVRMQTSRMFWPQYYARQLDKAQLANVGDLLRHYLVDRGFEHLSPHPAINVDHYAQHAENFDSKRDNVIQHLLSTPKEQRVSPSPDFCPQHYMCAYGDIPEHRLCPIEHFLMYGMNENRTPNAFYSEAYAQRWFVDPTASTCANYMMGQSLSPRRRVVFTSHDASRTGAPGIILRIIQDLSRNPDVECFCILDRGGDLASDFQKVCHARVLARSVYQVGPDAQEHRNEIAEAMSGRSFEYAICNSLETRHIARYLSEIGVPVLMLMHELPDYYPVGELLSAVDSADRVIVPSQFIHDRLVGRIQLDPGKLVVLGQGLLRDDIGTWSRADARMEVAQELSLPENAFVVMGCGTVDLRKGVDYFVGIARAVLAKVREDQPVQFLWYGHYDRNPGGTASYVLEEIERLGLVAHIRFVGGRQDMAKYFAAADVFLMSSRADPFPCVIHEAMASGLPVVCFKEGGGAAELVGETGMIAPLGDIEQAASAILRLIDKPDLQKELGGRAKSKILNHWRSADYARQLAELAREVTGSSVSDGDVLSSEEWKVWSVEPAAERTPPTRCTVHFLSPDWSVSGVNSLTTTIIRGLRAKGWDARILFTRGAHTKFGRDINGAPLMPDVPFDFCYPLQNSVESIWAAVKDHLNAHPPSIVVPNYDYVASSLGPVLSPHVRWVGIAHSDHVEHYEHVYRLGHYWDAIVSVSEQVKTSLLEFNSAFADKVHVIRCGVEADREARKSRTADSLKRPLSLVYAGRLVTEQKQVQRYVELCQLLTMRKVPFEFHVVGDGERLQWMRNEAVRFPGLKVHGRLTNDETRKIFSEADVFVLMSDYEGLPVSLVEALAEGCVPVVYPIRSGISEVITSGQNGIVTKSSSVSDVAEAIRVLARDRPQLARLSEGAVDSVHRLGLTSEAMAETYSAIFEQIIRDYLGQRNRRVRSFAWKTKSGAMPPTAVETFL